MAHKNLILICGDEEYLRDQKKKEILSSLGGEGGFNFHAFDIDTFDFKELSSLALTPPLLEPCRRILISHTGIFSKTHASAFAPETELLALLGDIPETTYLIFDEEETDGRGKLYKLIQKEGEIFRFESVEKAKGKANKDDAKALVKAFLRSTLSKEGLDIDIRTLEDLIELTGFDMRNLSTELEKLISYKIGTPGAKNVTKKDIEQIISRTPTEKIFQMADEKLSGHSALALSMLMDLFSLKTSPMRILYLLARQYDQAYFVKDCMLRRLSDARIQEATGLKDWQLRKIKEKIRGVGAEELRDKLSDIIDTEERIKRGLIDARLGVELLIVL